MIKYIANKEKLNISKLEYPKVAKQYIKRYGYDKIDEFINDCGKDYLDAELLKERVMNYVYEHADITTIY